MDWIAGQYRMRIPGGKPKECFDSYYPSPSSQNKARDWFSEQVVPGTGNESDIDKEDCWGSFNYDHKDDYTIEYNQRKNILLLNLLDLIILGLLFSFSAEIKDIYCTP